MCSILDSPQSPEHTVIRMAFEPQNHTSLLATIPLLHYLAPLQVQIKNGYVSMRCENRERVFLTVTGFFPRTRILHFIVAN